ncbi:MAG: hypothetical protein KatS3mg098_283 [Candidatus Parcubacteria bacterium]|nr:MAG: hypothetical protein KatS3mg098_283 [Candidatus Parcubacteria bacterium]
MGKIFLEKKEKDFFSDSFWRFLTNFWTLLFMGFLIFDFIFEGKFSYLVAAFSVIYASILSVFAGTKEFRRWQNAYQSKNHPGEIFVFVWTLVLVFLLLAPWIFKKNYQISSEVVSVYIMVLTIFALTQGSKKIYSRQKNTLSD